HCDESVALLTEKLSLFTESVAVVTEIMLDEDETDGVINVDLTEKLKEFSKVGKRALKRAKKFDPILADLEQKKLMSE
ncbi:hypothetical protein PFISCL1PPCAC_6714, partial [Pristionchus fissidentatus]